MQDASVESVSRVRLVREVKSDSRFNGCLVKPVLKKG